MLCLRLWTISAGIRGVSFAYTSASACVGLLRDPGKCDLKGEGVCLCVDDLPLAAWMLLSSRECAWLRSLITSSANNVSARSNPRLVAIMTGMSRC